MAVGRKIVSQEIDGLTFEVQLVGALTGQDLLLRLQRITGAGTGGHDFKDMVQNLSLDDLKVFTQAFGASSRVLIEEDGKTRKPFIKDAFDEVFSGKYWLMVKWLVFCVSYNFGDYFLAMMTKAEELKNLALVAQGVQIPTSESLTQLITDSKTENGPSGKSSVADVTVWESVT
jgi:hypothetical protein